MKNLLAIIALCLSTYAASASMIKTNPTLPATTIAEESFTVTLTAEDDAYFNSVYYCTIVEKVCFKAKSSIEMVQIMDSNNDIIMFLPIGSDVMHLAMDELSQGTYTVNIVLEGAGEIVKTSVVKK